MINKKLVFILALLLVFLTGIISVLVYSQTNNYYIISGRIYSDRVEFNNFIKSSFTTETAENPNSIYSAEFLNSSNNLLRTFRFEDSETFIDFETEEEFKELYFIIGIPEGTKKIVIKENGIKKGEFIISENAPVVSGVVVNGLNNLVSISWQASDIDESVGNGLVSHYKFEDNALDSVGSNNGTLIGDARIADDIEKGKVLSLDGNGDYASLAANPNLASKSKYTISAWIKASDVSKLGIFYGEGSTETGIPLLLISISGGTTPRIQFKQRSNSGTDMTIMSPNTISNNVWYHVTAVKRASNSWELYVDGVSRGVSSKSLGTTTTDNGAIGAIKRNVMMSFLIGSYKIVSVHSYFKGSIDEVKIWNRALTAGEIKQEYDSYKGKLNYVLFYGNEGNWNLIDFDIKEKSYLLDTSSEYFPGGNYKIKVLASDGFNTGEATSSQIFSVSEKGPYVFVYIPEEYEKEHYNVDDSLIIEASAYDAEDGELAGEWKINGQGAGNQNTLVIDSLEHGTHNIEFSATDSDGNTASDSIEIYAGYEPTVIIPI